jgi:hypothetical protein
MMEGDGVSRIEFLFCNRTDDPRTILGDRAATSPISLRSLDLNENPSAPITPSVTGSQRTYSTVSSANTRAKSDIWSRGSGTVTTDASSVSAPHPNAVQLPLPGQEMAAPMDAASDTQDDRDLVDLGYELTCEFGFINCDYTVHPSDSELWIHHTLSHFFNFSAPRGTICIYCDHTFNADEQLDAAETWRRRMEHIQEEHLNKGTSPNSARPDFALLKHMRANELMSVADYRHLTKYSERPPCPGLVPDDWEPPEKILKNERDLQKAVDIRKEERRRRQRKQR